MKATEEDLPAELASERLWGGCDGSLCLSLENTLVKEDETNGWEASDPTLHVVAVVI